MPTAVIDVGSNSVRLLVAEVAPDGELAVRADARSGLRLLRRLQDDRALAEESIDATIQTIAGLAAIARNAGATTVDGVATAALREAQNAEQIIARIKAVTGVNIRLIDGDEEARVATRGAVHALPVDSGISIDIGGGSLEIAAFTRDSQDPVWSMPLGALRLNDDFLSDPPKKPGIQALRQHVQSVLEAAGVSAAPHAAYVGTGGTIRAVAKVARGQRAYPVKGVHGYRLTRDQVAAVAARVSDLPRARVVDAVHVNADRAISFAAGTNALLEVMEYLAIDEMLVSGKGLREGVALTLAGAATPPWRSVRQSAVAALAGQFRVHSPERASWRSAIARALLQLLVDDPSADLDATLRDASILLDIGRSVDFYDKHAHSVEIILTADMAGFAQRDRAMIASTIERAGDIRKNLRRFTPVLSADDMHDVERAGVLLALADGIEPRTHAHDDLRLRREEGKRTVSIAVPLAAPWHPQELVARARRLFGKRLLIGEQDSTVTIEVR